MSGRSYNDKVEARKFYNSQQWRQMRDYVLRRDGYECQWCKKQGRVTLKSDTILEVDHIKELDRHPELALDVDNLRTLC